MEWDLAEIRASPTGFGRVELVVRRPAVGAREILEEGVLDPSVGLVGDTWQARPSPRTDRQITLMNARSAALIAGPRDRWALAGDQIYVDLDISEEFLPPGSQVRLGDAVVEVTSEPHTGCAKFSSRFGAEALKLVNSPDGLALRLRGLNARVVTGGAVRPGDAAYIVT